MKLINGFNFIRLATWMGLLTLEGNPVLGQQFSSLYPPLPAHFIFFPKKNTEPSGWMKTPTSNNTLAIHKMPPAMYALQNNFSPTAGKNHWGWFCHAEDRFRKKTGLPLYVRLGSVEQANRLEGK